MSNEIHDVIEAEAARIAEPPPPGQGIRALLEDAHQLCGFVGLRYEPKGEGDQRIPGLSEGGLAPTTLPAIKYLRVEIDRAHRALTRRPSPFPKAEVQDATRRLRVSLKWLSRRDTGLADEMAKVARDSAASGTNATKMLTLERYADLARERDEALRAVPAYDRTLVDRAERLVAGYTPGAAPAGEAVRRRRDALVVILRDQMQQVVSTADFVFAAWPAIAREAHSERARRARKPRPKKGTPS
jgi:hypothetical protein